MIVPVPAGAHANLVRAIPAPGAVLDEAPRVVYGEFSERLEPGGSGLEVLDRSGKSVGAGPSQLDPSNPAAMLAPVGDLPNGTYLVAWRTLSVVDGHLIRGSFAFSIGEPVAVGVAVVSQPDQIGSPAEPVFRTLLFLGLMVMLGTPLHLLVVRPAARAAGAADRPPGLQAAARWLYWPAAAAAAAGQVGLLVVQGIALAGDAAGIAEALTLGRWGGLWIARSALLLVWVALALLAARQATLKRFARSAVNWLLTAIAAGLLVTVSLGSHAAALSDASPQAAIADLAHLLGAAVWAGGLPALFVTLVEGGRARPPADRPRFQALLAARFSSLATPAVGAIVVSGAFAAWLHVVELDRLWSSAYGLALVAKLGLVVPLLALGALNLLWIRPRLERLSENARSAGAWLRRSVLAELVLGIGVLAAAATLTSLVPARQAPAPKPAGLVSEARADDLDLTLSLEPGRPGTNLLVLEASDARGALDETARIELQLKFLASDIGTTVLRPEPAGPGRFALETNALGLAGPWQVVAVVRRAGSFDVRAPFRFELGTPGPAAAGLSADPFEARRYWALSVAGVGLALALGTLLRAGWWPSVRRAVTVSGFAGLTAGLVLLLTAPDPSGAPPSVNPIPPNQESLTAGRSLYVEHCAQCHGDGGLGDGPLAAQLDPPPVNLSVHVPLHPDRTMFDFVQSGIAGTAMPAFRGQLTEIEIWHVINYLQTLPP